MAQELHRAPTSLPARPAPSRPLIRRTVPPGSALPLHCPNARPHSRWHFSFDQYYDPENMGIGKLRVFNHDTLVPGAIWRSLTLRARTVSELLLVETVL
jgi:hypothetical protein